MAIKNALKTLKRYVFLVYTLRFSYKILHSPRPPEPFMPNLDQLLISDAAKSDAINRRLHPTAIPLPDRLPDVIQAEVEDLLCKKGIVSKVAKEQVSDRDIARLKPFQWLNDELINFYGQLIMDRASEARKGSSQRFLDVHYFSTFFWPKLKTGYTKSRIGKWTKKVCAFSYCRMLTEACAVRYILKRYYSHPN